MTICAMWLSSPLNSALSWPAGGAGGFGVSVLPLNLSLQIINLLEGAHPQWLGMLGLVLNMPSIDSVRPDASLAILVGIDFSYCLPLLCPFRTCWHQVGINVLLCDQVWATASTFPKGTQLVITDGFPHHLRIHAEDLCGFFQGVVLHVLQFL